jgi:hypothetical protein
MSLSGLEVLTNNGGLNHIFHVLISAIIIVAMKNVYLRLSSVLMCPMPSISIPAINIVCS